jgi:sulfite exporter TauE/SafE
MTLFFGMGTLPALLGIGLGGSHLSSRHRRISDLLAGMIMIAMAIDLLARFV